MKTHGIAIKQQLKNASTMKEVETLAAKLATFKYASGQTVRRCNRIIKTKTNLLLNTR